MTRSNELTILTKERRIVDREKHRHRRLVDSDRWQWLRLVHVGDCLTDLETIDTDNSANIPGLHGINFRTSQALKYIHFLDPRFHHTTITLTKHDILALFQLATVYTSYGDTTYILRIIQRSNQHLRSTLQHLWFGDILDDRIKHSRDILFRLLPILGHPALLGGTINSREVKLLLGSIQTKHQVEYHFLHFRRAAIRLIHLINYHDRLQTQLNRFLQNKTSLRHRPLKGVYQ